MIRIDLTTLKQPHEIDVQRTRHERELECRKLVVLKARLLVMTSQKPQANAS